MRAPRSRAQGRYRPGNPRAVGSARRSVRRLDAERRGAVDRLGDLDLRGACSNSSPSRPSAFSRLVNMVRDSCLGLPGLTWIRLGPGGPLCLDPESNASTKVLQLPLFCPQPQRKFARSLHGICLRRISKDPPKGWFRRPGVQDRDRVDDRSRRAGHADRGSRPRPRRDPGAATFDRRACRRRSAGSSRCFGPSSRWRTASASKSIGSCRSSSTRSWIRRTRDDRPRGRQLGVVYPGRLLASDCGTTYSGLEAAGKDPPLTA